MRQLICILVLALTAQLCFSQSKSMDMSAMKFVWQIIEKLESDFYPTEKEWDELFSTPGYKALGDWNNKNIRENFELVFLPSKKEQLAKALNTNNYWWKRDLKHLISVKTQQTGLKKYQEKLDVEKILRKSLERAEVYLIKGITKRYPPPPVQFVIFSPDARSMGGSIIFDLKFTMDATEDDFINTLAHEAHHHYSNFMSQHFRYPDEKSSYEPIISTLNQLKTEGIADLIDKPFPPVIQKNDTAAYLIKINAIKAQSDKMKTLDSMLCKMSDDTTGMYKMGSEAFRLFPGNCHYNGQYMAVLIKKHLGTVFLHKAVTDPFLFFRLYKEACVKEKNVYVISDKAMKFISIMEGIFRIKKKIIDS